MDPTICYIIILDSIRDHDYALAREHDMFLKGWLDSGGFRPLGFEGNDVQIVLARLLRPVNLPASLSIPFRNIQCTYCDAGDIITSLKQAIDEGWVGIDFAADYSQASHLGACSNCRRFEDEDL